jgi:hypothetical protein
MMKALCGAALVCVLSLPAIAQTAGQICVSANLDKTTQDGTPGGTAAPVVITLFCADVTAQADQNDLVNTYRALYGQCSTTNGVQTCANAPTQIVQAWSAGIMNTLTADVLRYRRDTASAAAAAAAVAPSIVPAQ